MTGRGPGSDDGAPETILIIEDEAVTAELERRVVQQSGRIAQVVTRVEFALALLARHSYAAILLDYQLPDGDPWAVVAAAEAKQPRIPVIMVTAQGNERVASEAIHRGVADYVRKAAGFWEQLPTVLERVTRRAAAERAREWKARAILDVIPDLMCRLDGSGVYLDYQPPQQSADSYAPPGGIIGSNVRDVMPPALADEVLGRIRTTLETGVMQQWEYQLPLPSGLQDYEARMVVCGTDEVLAVVRNITSIKQAERTIQSSLREKDVLLQEIHHRVKNNLQVISSLINMQLRELSGVESRERDALRSCQSRVQAIALVHEKLYQTENYAQVPFSAYARSLAAYVFESMGISPAAVALVVQFEEFDLAVNKAIPCGLILNELISNALKHAFPDGRRGVIRVELVKVDRDTAALTVADDGLGMAAPLDIGRSKSLGMRLVSTLTRQLRGRLELTHQPGVTVRVAFPLSA